MIALAGPCVFLASGYDQLYGWFYPSHSLVLTLKISHESASLVRSLCQVDWKSEICEIHIALLASSFGFTVSGETFTVKV